MVLNRFSCLALGLGFLTWGSSANAQTLFFSDNFSTYTDGAALDTDITTINPVTLNTINNGSATPWDAHSTVGGGPIAVSNNKAVALQGGTGLEDIHRDSGQSQPTGSTWYFAATITVTDTRSVPGTGAINPVYFMHFMEDTNNFQNQEQMFRARTYLLPSSDPSKFRLGVSSGTKSLASPTDPDFNNDNNVDGIDFLRWQLNYDRIGATNTTGDANSDTATNDADYEIWKSLYGNYTAVSFPQELSFGVPYKFVASYTSDDDDTNPGLTEDGYAKLWVEPADSSSLSVTDSAPHPNISNDAARPMKWLAIRQGTSGLQNGPARIEIDSVAIGSDFAAVLAALTPSATGVPEPTSAALLALGLGAAFRGRRRSR